MAVMALGWLLFLWGGETAAQFLGSRYGERIIQATQGNVADAVQFIYHCHQEALWLTTFLALLILAHSFAVKTLLKHRQTRQWIVQACVGFVLINVWLGIATQTVLFWGLMWQGEQTQNLTRFHLKRLLLKQANHAAKAVILGSSQARAQLDEALLNQSLQPKLRTVELHFPGSHAYDIRLVHRKVTHLKADWIICYVSELNFYSGQGNDVPANFFGLGDLDDLFTPARTFVPPDGFGYGLLGHLLPVFRLRDVISQRLLGIPVSQIKQRPHDRAVLQSLEQKAEGMAQTYAIDAKSDFQLQEFESFIRDCREQNEKVLVLVGQLNPMVAERFHPKMREHMLSFLRNLQGKYPHLMLVETIPFQSPADYDDLTHANKATQARFTELVADILQKHLKESAPKPE